MPDALRCADPATHAGMTRPVSDTKQNGKGQMGIDRALIRDLADLLNETDLTEIEVEQMGMRIRVARQITAQTVTSFPLTQGQPAPAPAAAPSAAPAAAPAASDDLANNPGVLKSPMVGTAYLAPEPGAGPFVREGEAVKEGQTVMIVEAMKTMNPIVAHRSGKIAQVLVANEQPVEFGEPLLVIE